MGDRSCPRRKAGWCSPCVERLRAEPVTETVEVEVNHWKNPKNEKWQLRGYQIRGDSGRGQHVGTYMRSKDDGLMMAAAPELLAMLHFAIDCLDAAERNARTSGVADDIRAHLRRLGLPAHGG